MAYKAVEIFFCQFKLLGKQIGNTPAEIQPVVSGSQVNGLLQVCQGIFIITQTGICYSPVMVGQCEYGMNAQGFVKICPGSQEIPEVILADAPEK